MEKKKYIAPTVRVGKVIYEDQLLSNNTIVTDFKIRVDNCC